MSLPPKPSKSEPLAFLGLFAFGTVLLMVAIGTLDERITSGTVWLSLAISFTVTLITYLITRRTR